MKDKDKLIAELKAENVKIKTSYINFIAKLKREMITKDDIQDLKNTAKKFVEERNSLRFENERLKRENEIITGMCNSASNRFDKIYQTLQEIKAIAKEEYYAVEPDARYIVDKILNLITKAESER